MSFDKAYAYVKAYRQRKEQALDNRALMGWFATAAPDGDLANLITDTFNSSEENIAWKKLYVQPDPGADAVKVQGASQKVAAVAGARRDVRIQFAAAATSRPRLPLDYDRFAIVRSIFARVKAEALNILLTTKVTSGLESE